MNLECFGGEQPPPLFGGHTRHSLRWNFFAMSMAFSINHAVSTTPLMLASTLLGGGMGVAGNSVFFLSALVSSSLVSVPVTGFIGLRRALAVGLGLYALYAGGFAAALVVAASGDEVAARAIWIVTSVCGGMAGSIAWTAQGGYFATSASLLSTLTERPKEESTASLASIFSIIYLSTEVVAKLCFSVLQARWQAESVAWAFFAVAVCSALAALRLKDLPQAQHASAIGRCLGVVTMWCDPLVWLLSPTNLVFGFSASLMNGYVNANFASAELGAHTVGALGSLTAFSAATTALVLGQLQGSASKTPVIAFGAACFFGIAFCITVLLCCNGWGYRIVVLYIMQGMGRAVYESTNRSVFANFFHGDGAELAFANCALQVNFSKALCYYLQTRLNGHRLALVVGTLSAATPFLYCTAVSYRTMLQRSKPLASELDEVQAKQACLGQY